MISEVYRPLLNNYVIKQISMVGNPQLI